MALDPTTKSYLNDIARGRLALALVSARADSCPRGRCARLNHCLAAMGPETNWNKPRGDCPIMSDEEWRAVSLGIMRNLFRLRPTFEARASAEVAKGVAGSAAPARATRGGAWRGGFYWLLLWAEARGEVLVMPEDIVARQRKLVQVAEALFAQEPA